MMPSMNLASIIESTCPPLFRLMRRLNKTRRYFQNGAQLAEDMPRGHYYSPLPDVKEASHFSEGAAHHDTAATEIPGIDLRRDAQRALVMKMLPLIQDFPWTDCARTDKRFHLGPANQNFSWSDAIFLQAMLRHQMPTRVIEIGSGFSSALMLDTNDLYLGNRTRFTFIEPFPVLLNNLLRENDRGCVTLHAQPVQDVPLETYDALDAGDILFIDSSHISKTGSDVNHEIFQILPRLKPGVIIHVHDIFWPFEYPAEWLQKGRAFNEAYTLRAFLQFNPSFEILLWGPFVNKLMENELRTAQANCQKNSGASIWIRRV